ncbi:hypothetical protein [Flammeovirga aprica]|uniref:Uncharacterized protein n=1 Tax=Flammeovirga aprica JL-4 TaxID=694437 RepID=A0A7X9RZS1_9BACT|nr:hypothetical protein [Flammeovirga aprica]NME71706.1 hypothetical protein [Flammeovirga aprica JL-4]
MKLVLFLLLITSTALYAQDTFVQLNSGEQTKQKLQIKEELSILYQEKYRHNKEVTVTIYTSNYSSSLLQVKKKVSYGKNRLKFKLSDMPLLKKGEDYILELEEKYGRRNSLVFHYLEDAPPLDSNSTLEAISMNCDEGKNSIFSLNTVVNGGFPPYDITYTISRDKEQQDLLYEPFTLKNKKSIPDRELDIKVEEGFYIRIEIVDQCQEVHNELLFTNCVETNKIEFNINLFGPSNTSGTTQHHD